MYITKSIHAFDITYICLKTITDGDGRTDYSFIIYSNLDNIYSIIEIICAFGFFAIMLVLRCMFVSMPLCLLICVCLFVCLFVYLLDQTYAIYNVKDKSMQTYKMPCKSILVPI